MRRLSLCVCVFTVITTVPSYGASPRVAPTATTASAGDANGDGSVAVGDVFYLINFLYAGGPAPASLAVSGFTWRGAWSAGTTYAANDVVSLNGSSYVSITDANVGHSPDASAANWNLMAQAGASLVGGAAGGDLSGTFPNPTVAKVGGQTVANIAAGAVLANAATDAATNGAIVKRDAFGTITVSKAYLDDLVLPPTGRIFVGTHVFARGSTSNTFLGNDAGNATTTGGANTAVGSTVLAALTNGFNNTGTGASSLAQTTSGSDNTAVGSSSLYGNVDGSSNTAIGSGVLTTNTSGSQNTAVGYGALGQNVDTNANTAIGYAALSGSTGASNIAIGANAGGAITTGNANIEIGNQGLSSDSATTRIGTEGVETTAFLAGVATSPIVFGGTSVLVSLGGQLGIQASSRRFKFDIADMASATDRLLELRPVSFRYIAAGPDSPTQYGLIAEEVAEIYPELVTRDKEGQPLSVNYQALAPMLLNVVKKQQKTIDDLERRMETLERGASNARPLPTATLLP